MEDFISMTGKPNTVTKIITPTEEKYKILMLGSKVPGKPGGAVVVHCGNFDYAKKFHSNGHGRIDGLSEFYRDTGLKEGMTIRATYLPDDMLPRVNIEIL